MTVSIGNNLRQARQEAGLTQREAARKIGVSTLTIIHWEQGKHSPMPENAMKIAKTYGLDPGKLVSWFSGNYGWPSKEWLDR